MVLGFHGNAICLSGGTGTKLKSELLGKYYPFWWGITSGGKNHPLPTSIVDLDAATAEVFLEDSKTTILGSAGLALSLKLDNSQTEELKIILVESNSECYLRLQNVIKERWPKIDLSVSKSSPVANSNGVFLVNESVDRALDAIGKIDNYSKLGRSIFLFDPLRSVPWNTVQVVARNRIKSFYRIGTEFIIFLFTSDMFLGRDTFVPLPQEMEEQKWTSSEKATVLETDALLSGTSWRPILLNNSPIESREAHLVRLYRKRLHSWFRYVLPLPFAPKANQTYHLFFCSNFEVGVRVTRSFFSDLTGNPKYSPDNSKAFDKFRVAHPDKMASPTAKVKPVEFRILWKIIKEHEEGFCDILCQDLMKEERDTTKRRAALEWLRDRGYLRIEHFEDEWGKHPPTYMLNWKFLQVKLGIEPPLPLEPLMPKPVQA